MLRYIGLGGIAVLAGIWWHDPHYLVDNGWYTFLPVFWVFATLVFVPSD